MTRGKTIVFIDNSSVFHGQREVGWRIDARKLVAYMQRDGEIWQTFFFASVSDPPSYKQTNFYKFVKNDMRFETEIFKLGQKTYRCNQCGREWRARVEKGVDVALATKLLTLANARAFDTAILIGADRDFLGTIHAVKAQGMRVEIYAWRGTISEEMEAESSARVVYLDDIKNDVIFRGEPDEEAEQMTTDIEIEEVQHNH